MRTNALHGAIAITVLAAVATTTGPVAAQTAANAPIRAAAPPSAAPPPAEDDPEAAQEARDPDAAAPQSDAGTSAAATTDLAPLTVTGTRIRGGATPSPVISIDHERIRTEGFATLGDVVRSLPQNFNGGQNPGVIGAATGVANQDSTGGSALNLRGLGPDASLTLLNGRRMAYDGFSQAVDISAIPVEVVERVDVIPDGASAIYGSDAVGGVANVVLRTDLEGLALGVRYGGATSGGLDTTEFTAAGGADWGSGGFVAALKRVDAGAIRTRDRSYTRYLPEPYTIYGASDTRSGLLGFRQSFGDAVEARIDALRTDRHMARLVPGGAVHYRYDPNTSITTLAPSVTFAIGDAWAVTAGGAVGRNENVDERYLVSGEGTTKVTETCYCNRSRSIEIGAEGPVLDMGDREVRLAVGAGQRYDEFSLQPRIGGRPFSGEERARFAYAEANVPLVARSHGLAAADRLEASLAIRAEDYDSFGQVTTPKVGLIYSPTPDVTIKTSWGRSFKAPTLVQRNQNRDAYLWLASAVGGDGPSTATALMSYGGNADLEPERARTWTASLALHPVALPGFEAELTWFDIDYTDRVVEPVNYQQALSNPAYADFVDLAPTPQEIEALLAEYDSAFYNLSGQPFDPDDVVAIIRNHYVNAARQRIRGLDLSGAYAVDLARGRLSVTGSASWLDSSQVTAEGRPAFDLAGTIFNPARVNGRAGLAWLGGGFSASGSVNYSGGVTNLTNAGVSERTASFTTVDTTLGYEFAADSGALEGASIVLSAQNLLNREPPLHTTAVATFVPYDATNYSAIGRFVSITIRKAW